MVPDIPGIDNFASILILNAEGRLRSVCAYFPRDNIVHFNVPEEREIYGWDFYNDWTAAREKYIECFNKCEFDRQDVILTAKVTKNPVEDLFGVRIPLPLFVKMHFQANNSGGHFNGFQIFATPGFSLPMWRLSDHQLELVELVQNGVSIQRIADMRGVNHSAIYRSLQRAAGRMGLGDLSEIKSANVDIG